MNVAVIGADRPWGALLATGLGAGFEVVAIGSEDARDFAGYRQVDLLERASLDPMLARCRGCCVRGSQRSDRG